MKFMQRSLYLCLTRDVSAIVGVYVIAGKILVRFKSEIADRFEAKDLGELHYFLGVKITRKEPSGLVEGLVNQVTPTVSSGNSFVLMDDSKPRRTQLEKASERR